MQITCDDNNGNPWKPACEEDHKCLCIFEVYRLLGNAIISQHTDRSKLGTESTSRNSSSDKELIKGEYDFGDLSVRAHERCWQGAEVALPY